MVGLRKMRRPTPAWVFDVQLQISPGSHAVLGVVGTMIPKRPEALLCTNRESRKTVYANRLQTLAQAPCPLLGRVGPLAWESEFSGDKFPRRDSGRITENVRDKTSAKNE